MEHERDQLRRMMRPETCLMRNVRHEILQQERQPQEQERGRQQWEKRDRTEHVEQIGELADREGAERCHEGDGMQERGDEETRGRSRGRGVAKEVRIAAARTERGDDPGEAGVEPEREQRDQYQPEASLSPHREEIESGHHTRDRKVLFQERRHHEEQRHRYPAPLVHEVEREQKQRGGQRAGMVVIPVGRSQREVEEIQQRKDGREQRPSRQTVAREPIERNGTERQHDALSREQHER
jgi:hypothetical protein